MESAVSLDFPAAAQYAVWRCRQKNIEVKFQISKENQEVTANTVDKDNLIMSTISVKLQKLCSSCYN